METIDIKLKQMWDEGRTGTEIAKALGMTRNAVMGRIHRLRGKGVQMGSRPAVKPKKDKTAPTTKVITMPFVMPKYHKKPKAKKEVEEVAEVIELVIPQPEPKLRNRPKTLMQLKPFDCRWIRPDNLYCGEEAKSARTPWCTEHYALVYAPRKKLS